MYKTLLCNVTFIYNLKLNNCDLTFNSQIMPDSFCLAHIATCPIFGSIMDCCYLTVVFVGCNET